MRIGYVYLLIAIAGEVCATTALKSAEEFTRLVPSVIVIVGYGVALTFLSLTLRTIPIGIAYAIWAGVGTAAIGLAGYVIHHQSLDARAIAGMVLIAAGVALVNGSSSTVP